MKDRNSGSRLFAILALGFLVVPLLSPTPTPALDYGRLAGSVSDDHGNPLMGATVLIIGPLLIPTATAGDRIERVITDAKGKFAVADLIPGWYSLQVVSPSRLPAHRNGIRVEPGQTSNLKFVLGDVFAPLRFQLPDDSGKSLGDGWKWVLRTSAATRPILRYQQDVQNATASSAQTSKPSSQRLIGVGPGPWGGDPQAGDPGVESIVAYLRSASPGSEVLTVGSVAANGVAASTVGTEYRKALPAGDLQQVSLTVHQLGYAGDGIAPSAGGGISASSVRAMVATVTQSRSLSPNLTLTGGMDVYYLNGAGEVFAAQPRARLAVRVSRSTDLAFQVGRPSADGFESLPGRIANLGSLPLLTLRGYRAAFEQIGHSEFSLTHQMSRSARFEVAAYRDGVRNAAVWGSARPPAASWLAGNYMLNPAGDGIYLNMGDYRSAGYRVAYAQRFGHRLETLVTYTTGDALRARECAADRSSGRDLQPVRSASLAGKVSARLPGTQTQLTTSYEWVQRGRLTTVDPYGQADMRLQPFLDVQIRQPLPAPAFFPAHIEAVADFRNLLSQGYSPLTQSGEKSLLLGSVYSSVRGGFSVEF